MICPECNIPMTDMGQWPCAERLGQMGLWSKPIMHQAWRCEQCRELLKYPIEDKNG